jgi:hypothetical protein
LPKPEPKYEASEPTTNFLSGGGISGFVAFPVFTLSTKLVVESGSTSAAAGGTTLLSLLGLIIASFPLLSLCHSCGG